MAVTLLGSGDAAADLVSYRALQLDFDSRTEAANSVIGAGGVIFEVWNEKGRCQSMAHLSAYVVRMKFADIRFKPMHFSF